MQYPILWINRFRNFSELLHELTAAVEASRRGELSSLEKQGLIRTYEFTYDSAWLTMSDFLKSRGIKIFSGDEGTIKEAYEFELIQNIDIWTRMISDRKKLAGFIDEEASAMLLNAIAKEYHPEFLNLENRFLQIIDKENINMD